MSNRVQLTLILLCVAAALVFVGFQLFRASGTRTYSPDAVFTEAARLTQFESNGVRVALFLESDGRGLPLLRARFAPTNREFHLYSKDLDPITADGIGTPTRVELLPHPSLRAAGSVFADAPVRTHRVKGLEGQWDLYPDGPVSLRLPIQFVGGEATITVQVAVSYMACETDGVCLDPVEGHVLKVAVSRSHLRR